MSSSHPELYTHDSDWQSVNFPCINLYWPQAIRPAAVSGHVCTLTSQTRDKLFKSYFLYPQAPWASVRRSRSAPSPLCWGPLDLCPPPTSSPAPTDPLSFIPPTTSSSSPTSTSRRSTICAHSTLRVIQTGQQHIHYFSIWSMLLFHVFFFFKSWRTWKLHYFLVWSSSRLSCFRCWLLK